MHCNHLYSGQITGKIKMLKSIGQSPILNPNSKNVSHQCKRIRGFAFDLTFEDLGKLAE